MKKTFSSAAKTVGGVILVAFVFIAIIKLIPETANQSQPGTSNNAYPPPNDTPTQTSSPIPYPPPGKIDNHTQTPIIPITPTNQTQMPIITLTPSGTMPRPTEWPTEWPWPPVMTPRPYATQQATFFPTPVFPPLPSGKIPAVLQKLWYAYSPDSVSSPMIQVEQIDSFAQRWGKSHITVDLGLDRNYPGPFLSGLLPSPDAKWIAAQLNYGEAGWVYLINSDTGKAIQILPQTPSGVHIFSWKPDSQKIVARVGDNDPSVIEVDIYSGEYQRIEFPKVDGISPAVDAIAFSPDGSLMADILVYPPIEGGRKEYLLSIGITDVKSQERKTIQEISTAWGAEPYSLQWSADGRFLAWIAQKMIILDKSSYSVQSELWISNRVSGETKSFHMIGENLRRIDVSWSPDGKKIAIVKYDDKSDKNPNGNIILIDPVNGTEAQVDRFSGQAVYNVQWASDGLWLFCNVSNAEFGTIWAINIENGTSFPAAGPVTPYSPFIIVP